jgi:hypothetical protein
MEFFFFENEQEGSRPLLKEYIRRVSKVQKKRGEEEKEKEKEEKNTPRFLEHLASFLIGEPNSV